MYCGVVLCDISEVFTHSGPQIYLSLPHTQFVACTASYAINQSIAFTIGFSHCGVCLVSLWAENSAC